jgi:adenine-specific DNA-methyltransferase
MVTPATDPDEGKTRWSHDPHLDPTLSWSGKAERLSFAVDTVSLHVHERIDPASILSAARKVGAGDTAKGRAKSAKAGQQGARQPSLFDASFESLLVMNSLLQKEDIAGQVHKCRGPL